MVALQTPNAELGWIAPNFSLKGTDTQTYTLENVRGKNGLVVMFICNHCPFVKAVLDKIIRDIRNLQSLGIGAVAIMSNDTQAYPDDSFEHMQQLASDKRLPFPYVIDETQEVARAYGAVCTPDFFGFNRNLELQYRGRLDASGRNTIPDTPRDLFEAMKLIATTQKGPTQQLPSIGCSIKWRG